MKVKVGGLSVGFEVSGKGRDVLLLHGWGSDRRVWAGVAKCLDKDFRVITPDLPGFGESEHPERVWDLDEYAELTVGITQELGLDRPVVIGHSMGGAVAVKMAVKYPNLLGKLVLVSCSGVREKSIKKLIGWGLAKSGKWMLGLLGLHAVEGVMRGWLYEILGERDYLESGVNQRTFLKVVKEDIRRVLPEVKTPTLLIWGEKDKETPLRFGRMMNSLILESRLVVLREAGHFPFVDQQEDFCRVIREFIEG